MANNIKTRVIHKHDTEANWQLATNFTPLDGELIIYDVDASHSKARVKIGDGETNVNSLPFIGEGTVVEEATSTTAGIVKYDNSSIVKNTSGQLEVGQVSTDLFANGSNTLIFDAGNRFIAT